MSCQTGSRSTAREAEELRQRNLSFLAGGGEMGERMRALDWSRTPLGPPEHWPQSLKTIVRVMLDSRYAMWMLWGRELTFFCNDAYLPTVGIKRDWVLGARSDKVWEEIWTEIGPRIAQVLEQGRATWDEALLLFLERSGFPEETYHTFSYSPIYDDESHIAGMLCVVTEVTHRVVGERRLRVLRDLAAKVMGAADVEESCRRACKVLEHSPLTTPFAAIYLLDEQRQTARRVAATRADLDTFLPAQLSSVNSTWPLAQLLSSHAVQHITNLPASGVELTAGSWPDLVRDAFLMPLKGSSEGMTGFLVVGASPRRALDEAYRSFFGLLAGQIAAALAGAQAAEAERHRMEALAEIDRAKTAFFSNVSHEFRTPLTLLLGPVEEAAIHPTTTVPVRAHLELAHRNALRLQKLVNSLLDFSRIEAGRVQASYEPVHLHTLTSDLASNFRSAMEQAALAFEVECADLSEPVYVDRGMWEKIVLNLLSNAFKFTLHGGVRVRLRREGETVVLEVADTGVGIPREELPRLFERFHRVEGTMGRTQEGSGIGLALVQELVKLHGGTINVTSEPGTGTAVCVSLPLGNAHLPAERIKAPTALASTAVGAQAYIQEALRWLPERPGDANCASARVSTTDGTEAPSLFDRRIVRTAGARILLCDDNADMRSYLRDLLSPHYRVEAVSDGEQALAAARAERPDLILSDIMMPRMDGFALLEALRADEALRGVPIILLSARAGEESRIEGLDAGADDYLVKPFSARELLARVGALLELTQIRHEHEGRLRVALSSIRDQFYLLDRNWRFVLVNPRVTETTGKSESELLGRSIFELYPDLVGSRFEAELAAAARSGEPHRFQYEYTPWQRCFESAVYPAGDGVAVLTTDITERRHTEQQLRQSEERFRSIVDQSVVGIAETNVEGLFSILNDQYCAMVGYSREELLGMRVHDLTHPADLERSIEPFLRCARDGVPFEIEKRYLRKNGSTIWVRNNVNPLRDPSGRIRALVAVSEDITQRKWAEDSVRAQIQILEQVSRGVPLSATLDDLMRFLEAQEPGARCGLLLAAEDGQHFRRGSGPSLPEQYHQALDGVPITPPYLGSCGEAAHTCEAVVVPDVRADTRYASAWRELLLSCGLQSVRSSAVRGADGRVLGSLAIYHDHPRDPTPANPQLIEIGAHLAAIAIERQSAEAAIKERSEALTQAHSNLTIRSAELVRFNQAAVGRELRMVELKDEVNELRERLGESARYSAASEAAPPASAGQREPEVALAPLESILRTDELRTRPSRPPDYEGQIRILTALVQALALSPKTILQTLAQSTLEALHAGSAGVSLLTEDGGRFYWAAIAGEWSPHLGGGTPSGFGPCGDVLDHKVPMLFTHWERRYPYLAQATPLAEEGLLVPFEVEGRQVGTIWVIAHDADRRFDAEDLRLLESLAAFACVASQALQRLNALDQRRAALSLLEDAVQARQLAEESNRKLRQSEEELREADRRKSEFLALLGHELRNPLSPIAMASELLLRTRGQGGQSQFAVEMIKRQTSHLTRLVDDLLDIGRITQGRIQLRRKPLDLATVIAQAAETVEPLLREKQHEISITTLSSRPLYVHGDFVRLVQCVVNILSNAAKYSDPNEKIRIETRAEQATAIIEISDTGTGIAPELLPRIFDLFVQSERTLDRAQGGLGIGLSIVKRLIEMHDGEVSASSAGIGRGSKFQIRLPRIERPDTVGSGASPVKGPPRRVLVVDDNADSATSLAMLLKFQGHEAMAVYGAKDALAQVESFQPEVALLDIGLPEMDGYELAKRLRATPELEGLRLIALTGYGQAEDRQRALAAGFDEHLVKPVDLPALERTLAGFAGMSTATKIEQYPLCRS